MLSRLLLLAAPLLMPGFLSVALLDTRFGSETVPAARPAHEASATPGRVAARLDRPAAVGHAPCHETADRAAPSSLPDVRS